MFHSGVVEPFYGLKLRCMQVHFACILAQFIVYKGTVSEVWDDVRQPAVDNVPLRAFFPPHDTDYFLGLFHFVSDVIEVWLEV